MAKADGCALIRIPDGCKQVGRYPTGLPKLIRVKAPFDWILRSHDGGYAFIDTKSTDAARLGFAALHPFQIQQLEIISRPAKAGYIVAFRKLNQVTFFPIQILSRLQPRESLGPADGIPLGGLEFFSPRLLFQEPEARLQRAQSP